MKLGDAWRTRAIGLFVVGMASVAAVPAAYGAHVAMPYNPIHLPYEARIRAATLLPEGWKFFTRDPEEEAPYVLVRTETGWAPIAATNATAANWFGASRKSRAMAVELGRLMTDIPKEGWTACKEDPGACLDRESVTVRVKDVSERPQLCGKRGLVLQKPVPWAWRNADPKEIMPSRILLLDVEC